MIDNPFRSILPNYVGLLLKCFHFLRLHPNHITWLGFWVAFVAASLVYFGYFWQAAVVWWLSRLLDGTDGIYARTYQLTTKFGAYLDIQLDMAAYSIMIVAFYFQFPGLQLQWLLILLAYVLCITGALSLGSFETDVGLKDNSGRGLRLASGLAEGGETGIAYTVFLLIPQWLFFTTWIWLGVLTITVVARFLLAYQELKEKQ